MATPATALTIPPQIKGIVYSGRNWDGVVVVSASRTTAPTIPQPLINFGGTKLIVYTDITVNAGGLGSITVSIYNYDSASDKYFLVLATVALTAVATSTIKVVPTYIATASANVVANEVLARQFKVDVVHNNANPITYSIGISVTA